MLDRRTLITATSAAVALTAAMKPTLAALPETRDVKIDPFNMTAAERKLHPGTKFAQLDQNSFQNFADGIRKSLGGHGAQTANTAHRNNFLKSKGLNAIDDTDMSFEQAWATMMDDPVYAAKMRLTASTQHLMWDRARRAFNSERDKYLAAMEKTDKSGPGRLELDPSLNIPEYARYEIHTQPGGFVGDPFAGWVYNYALDVGFHEDFHPEGKLPVDGNGRDQLYLGLAQSTKIPADGQIRRILDLGCGCGQYTTSLKERFPDAEVWGVDMSGPMVRYAHHRAVNMKIDVNIAQRLAEDTRFPNNYFDIVTDHILLHEVPAATVKMVIAEAHRVLRPGGVFDHFDSATAGDPSPPAKTVPAKAALWWLHRYNFEVWNLEYATTDLPQVMRNVGFNVELSDPWARRIYPGVMGTKQA